MARKYIVSSDDGSRDEKQRESESSSSESSGKERNRDGANYETNLVNLRWTIYMTITSSADIEEALHKLLNIKVEEMELCMMLLECCSQEKSYIRYYGHLGQRLCMINQLYQENFDKCFVHQYSTATIHRLKTTELHNVAKFFAHLVATDALPWHVLANIRLTEEEGVASSSSRGMFTKILFQELSQHLGIRRLNERLSEPAMRGLFDESIFPRDNPNNTRFSIKFFTSIGLGAITENLRVYLKNMPRLIKKQHKAAASESESDSYDSESDSSPSSYDGTDSESDSSSSSSDESERCRKRKRISQFRMKKKGTVQV